MQKEQLHTKGFSLVEIILSAALFALLVTALIGAVIYGRESTAIAGARARAIALAEEGLEATRNIRDASFATLTDGNHGLAIASNQWAFSGTSDTISPFTRQVVISTPSTNRRQAVSTVTWQQTPSRAGSAVLTTYHTNWRASAGAPTSCTSFCQSLGIYNGGQCRADAAACTSNGETHQSGGDQYCLGAASVDTCCCQP